MLAGTVKVRFSVLVPGSGHGNSAVGARPRAMRRAGQTGPGMTHQDSVRVRPVGLEPGHRNLRHRRGQPGPRRRAQVAWCTGQRLARTGTGQFLRTAGDADPHSRGGHASEAQCEPRYQAAPQLGQDARGIGSIRRSIDKIRSRRNCCNLLVRAGNGNVPYHPCHGSEQRLTLGHRRLGPEIYAGQRILLAPPKAPPQGHSSAKIWHLVT